MSLTEILKENIGATGHQTVNYLQDLVEKGELAAYRPRKTSTVWRIRIIKAKKVEYDLPLLIEYIPTGSLYQIEIRTLGGGLNTDQTTHHSCYIEKISHGQNVTKMTRDDREYLYQRIKFPQKLITATLRMSYDQNRDGSGSTDVISGTRSQTIIVGENDELFKKICDFFRQS